MSNTYRIRHLEEHQYVSMTSKRLTARTVKRVRMFDWDLEGQRLAGDGEVILG